MSGWTAQVDIWAKGAHLPIYSFTQHDMTHTLDGDGAYNFALLGGASYSNVLFHKSLGTNSGQGTQFTLDMMLFIDHPENSQALEFAVLQSHGKKWYKFSTQAQFSGGVWRAWSGGTTHHWVASTASCPRFPAMTWNHLVFEYEIVNDQTHFISVSVNGNKQYMNLYETPESLAHASENITTHFQIDGNRAEAPYKVWIDKLNVTTN
ncbi:MAG: hypothetical protein ABI383_09365 [Acidobacteriaceae bacterium]